MIQSGNYKICFIPINSQEPDPGLCRPSASPKAVTDSTRAPLKVNLLVERPWDKVARVAIPVLKIGGIFVAAMLLHYYTLVPKVVMDDIMRLFFIIVATLVIENSFEKRTRVRLPGYAVDFI